MHQLLYFHILQFPDEELALPEEELEELLEDEDDDELDGMLPDDDDPIKRSAPSCGGEINEEPSILLPGEYLPVAFKNLS